MRAIPLFSCLLLLACSSPAGQAPPDVLTDLAPLDGVAAVRCGDGLCGDGEDCLACPADCACSCGDGLCTAGEYCALCPEDCDCDALAATPPMGWNSWNKFACDVSAGLITEMAEAMVASGLRDVGYRYVNVDDCWQVERGEDGVIVADPERFPAGMAALADAVHALGLDFGLYTDVGPMTCQERPGSYGYEAVDAATYADWGVDYVKVDWCFNDGLVADEIYAVFGAALAAAGRPIVYSICNWGVDAPWIWGPETGHLWRTTGDIGDIWPSVMLNLLGSKDYAAAAGPGHWNDPDMLEVGNGGMTSVEYRSHFNLWAMMAAPLLAGNDLRDMDEETLAILTNTEVIAVDQDPDGIQGVLLPSSTELLQVWSRPLRQYGARAVLLFNASPATAEVGVRWEDIGLTGPAAVRDLWAHEELGELAEGTSAVLAPHESRMMKVVGAEIPPPSGETPLSALPWMHAANAIGAVERDGRDGAPLRIAGQDFEEGLAVGAVSMLVYHLGGDCEQFTVRVGLDDTARADATACFALWGDDALLAESAWLSVGDGPVSMDADVTGRRRLRLVVSTEGHTVDGVLADWAEPLLTCR